MFRSILGNVTGRQRLEEMARQGFRLSLDDFGSGYSSFDMVGEIPFHELKIYSGLIKKMDQPRGKGIVQAVVDMGHTLGLTVVAEGVEQEDQVRRLREMGIHKIQATARMAFNCRLKEIPALCSANRLKSRKVGPRNNGAGCCAEAVSSMRF